MDPFVADRSPFAVPDWWRKSTLANHENNVTNLAPSENIEPLEPLESFTYLPVVEKANDFRSSDLSSIDIGPLEDVETIESAFSSPAEEVSIELPFIEEDIWTFPQEDPNLRRHLRTWQEFQGKSFPESRTPLMSEKDAQYFDSILAAQSDSEDTVILSKTLVDGLVQLCLGRESLVFVFVEDCDSFALRIDHGRMSGLSCAIFKSLCAIFIRQGNTTRNLHAFTCRHQRCETTSPTLVAVAAEISKILEQLEHQFMEASPDFKSLLQMQDLSTAQTRILEHLMGVTSQICKFDKEHDVLSLLFLVAQNTENGSLDIREASLRILVAASAPWEAALNHWLGFVPNALAQSAFREQSMDMASEALVAADAEMGLVDELHALDFPKAPQFIGHNESEMISELVQNLQLMRAHTPQHPILNISRVVTTSDVRIAWRTSWHSIERMADQVREYKTEVEKAINAFHLGGSLRKFVDVRVASLPTNDVFPPMSKSSAMHYIRDSMARIEASPGTSSQTDRFQPTSSQPQTREMSYASGMGPFSPPVSLLPSLSFHPVIVAQAELVNRACLRLLFEGGELRRHLSILLRFKMLSDGVFSSRLCQSLFSQKMSDGEGRTGHDRVGTSGLLLGYRTTWPPMSSELRLAVRGILTDSYFPLDQLGRASMFREEIPGGLSFAIAELNEKELARCTNPDSVYALDFLQLQYQAPRPIAAIITPASLMKYDAIFKLLLRAKRMLFVAEQMAGDILTQRPLSYQRERLYLRFRQQAHHFVSSICTYFFESVAIHWQRLDNRLSATEAILEHGDLSGNSIAELRRFHECVLDEIMLSLLLRKRQSEVLQLLEDIFGIILQLASSIRKVESKKDTTDQPDHAHPADLYQGFQKKVKIFVTVCRGLSEQRMPKGTAEIQDFQAPGRVGDLENGTISQLLLRFEMNGFYAAQ